MNRTDLLAELGRLQAEARALEDTDHATREHVAGLIEGLSHQLENPDDEAHFETLRERTSAAIERFEVEHPQLTDTLNRIMVALGI